ncbi:dihydrolipoyl dehydrogenase family protein [Aestuariispira ectoiniformans]|uniref:dihydrolipoyl dehydrogenase family protein n=1 Tax=Aestuariispira ectoiniformans TaxID=2775080 RepID=UPI00223B5C2C|nr:FAD-dependent oxidoreductase [Aestuariispira ectoiniformans]
MAKKIKTDICVIGGGSGGLSVAAGASQMGAKVILIESGKMGGDCLNYGCVPSKALLAAAHRAQDMRQSAPFGITPQEPSVDMQAVHDHVHNVIAGIAPHDSVERFEGLGVTVIQDTARFTGRRHIQAGGQSIKAKYFVIATGSSAFVPPIDGLADTPYWTNETIFDVTEPINHLIVIGGGPIGMELAQAHRRLGAKVTVVEMLNALGKDDGEAAEVVKAKLRSEGIDLREGTAVTKVAKTDAGIAVTLEKDGNAEVVEGSHLLVAVGRKPNIETLNLDKAAIEHSPKGIAVDARLRTSNRRVFAIGDVTGGYQFTHMAGYDAGIVIRNCLFKLPAKAKRHAVPWVTYTDPELAQVGLQESQAIEDLGAGNIRILRWAYGENDRARAEGQTDGFIKVITDKKGYILGATIVGAQAGELIGLWCLAVQEKKKIGSIAGLILPYPTRGELSKRAAGSFFTPSLFSEKIRRIVRFLMAFS